ncbi:Integrase [hydrothermal vent metagenome]|uniref:Integrase n=1 Tax=hydrothermal vent metagenome TaxID=652676 RepID=A0A3B1EA45_9ZZZZ
MFLNYLEKTQKIPKNPIRGIIELIEEPNPYKNYTEEDLKKLFQISDYETKQFFKIALYTGLRLSAMISIKKEDIEFEYGEAYKLTITKDKTTNGQRTITVHKEIKDFLTDFKNSKREYLFFNTDNKDKVQKYINPLIFNTLGERKTIHGFRKNFTIELYKATENNNLRKYIIGHSQKSDLTFTIYNLENVDFDMMQRVINKVSYPIIEEDNKQPALFL